MNKRQIRYIEIFIYALLVYAIIGSFYRISFWIAKDGYELAIIGKLSETIFLISIVFCRKYFLLLILSVLSFVSYAMCFFQLYFLYTQSALITGVLQFCIFTVVLIYCMHYVITNYLQKSSSKGTEKTKKKSDEV